RVVREYGPRGVRVVGVNMQDLEPEALRFMREFHITYTNVRDRDGRVPRAYGVTGVPETFFIDARGRVVRKFPGVVVDYRVWQAAVESLLASEPAR
ncbi:MAG: TlpA family protein disulfide reductase, partial [Armatimonadetes bacterium]|nr:TlpA family protein disulfide reductase [Armatimonadota bacterium]